MKALLDTHVFLWWNTDDSKLSPLAREVIGNGDNEIYISAVSAWEITIKYQIGRLELPEPPQQYVPNRMAMHRFLAMPIQVSHTLQISALPPLHKDPFDRLLIAQSQMENIPLITADDALRNYDIEIIW